MAVVMVTILAWLYLVLLLAVPIGLVLFSLWRPRRRPNQLPYQTMLDLRAIRRRQEVAQFKSETRRDAAKARRDLRHALSDLARREREP
ncbi:MAG TPA: hypothetical protein VG147_07980 [Solirubrobacteraceae bacterium]|nr:hypothetical protein [Solirubrobacteraceae bacterium]